MHRPLMDRFNAEAWDAGRLLPQAPVAAGRMIARLDDPDASQRAQLALLLGVLAEGHSSDASRMEMTRAAVRAGLDRFLELLNGHRGDEDRPLRASLLFLLAHFPEDRSRVLAVARAAGLDADELSRLDRCLQQPRFPDAKAARRLGRSWPSPATCDTVVRAHGHEHGLTHAQGLAPDELVRIWELETVTLLAYSGARAHDAIDRSIP